MAFSKLPSFLFCEDLKGDRYFVMHTQEPRFLAEFTQDEDGCESSFNEDIVWIDEPPCAAKLIAKIMRQAGDFLNNYNNELGVD